MSDKQQSKVSQQFTIECADCGGRYDPDNEVVSDHEPDCPVREAFIGSGRWEDPR